MLVACSRLIVFHRVSVSSASDLSRLLWFGSMVGVFWCLGTDPVGASELHLRNGDRITGELTHRADGKIYFRSRLAGDIVVSESDAVIIDTVDTPVESLTGLPPAKEETPIASAAKVPAPNAWSAGKSTTASTSSKAPTRTGGGASGTPGTAGDGHWKGKVEFGFLQQSGRLDSLTTSLRVDAERERGGDQLKASARALYGEQNDAVNTDRTDASFRWRHQLSTRVFAQSVTSFLSDDIKKIDRNYEQNVGIGYALFKRERHVINVGGGLTGQYRDAENIGRDFAMLGEVFEDYTYRINGRLTFLQDLLAQYSPVSQSRYILRNNSIIPIADDVQNYRIRVNTSLQGKITERVSMNLRFEYEYDNTIADKSAKSDQRISSTLGYAF